MNFLAYLILLIFLLGAGAFVVFRLRLFNCLNTFELCAASIITGGFINYLLVETVGRLSLTTWSMGLSAAVIAPFAIYGLVLMSRHLAADRPIESFFKEADLTLSLITGACIVLLGLGMVQAFAPPNTYDTLNYHLFLPQYDVARGFNGPRWDHNTSFSFFPTYLSHLTRTALLYGDTATAQLITVSFVGLAAAGAANLSLKLSEDARIAAFAAFLVLTNRAVTWQMPTLEIDSALGAFTAVGAALFLRLRDGRETGLMAVLCIVLGCSILTKHHGLVLAFALGTSFIAIHSRSGLGDLSASVRTVACVAAGTLLVISPLLIRNYLFTSDPLYPLLDLHERDLSTMYGTGRGLLDLLASPVLTGLLPRTYFDGMMFGAPILLALVPLGLLIRPLSPLLVFLWVTVAIYYLVWFYFLSQQTRFLLPVLPIFAVIGALGTGFILGRLARVPKGLMIVGLAGLFTVQASFVGIYSLLRVPVAIGLQSKEAYFQTPSFDGAVHQECKFMTDRLKAGDRILALTLEGLSYCPPLRTDYALTPLTTKAASKPPMPNIERWLENAKHRQYAFVLIKSSRPMRHRDEWSAAPVEIHGPGPLGKWFELAIASLAPVADYKHIRIYSGPAFIAELEARIRNSSHPPVKPK